MIQGPPTPGIATIDLFPLDINADSIREKMYRKDNPVTEFRNGAGKPVVGLDIDGTLGDYHGHFLRFAEGYFGHSFPPPDAVNPGLRLSTFMDVDHRDYRDCKLAYRQGGMKRTMPAYPHAAHLTMELKVAGAEIWICTTRPYLRLDNIDPDTREWLRRNQIQYDAVLFDDPYEGELPHYSKYSELARQVGRARIVAVADDLAPQLQIARQIGIRNCYLRSQPYNVTGSDTYGLRRVDRLEQLEGNIVFDIENWKERQEQWAE
jgi:phosphoglycolate phosphatase-like HAD superfamily hydrolase